METCWGINKSTACGKEKPTKAEGRVVGELSNNNKNSSALEVATENELPLRELIVACGNCLNADASSSMFPYPYHAYYAT